MSDKPAAPTHEQWLRLRQHWHCGGRLSEWQIAQALNAAVQLAEARAATIEECAKVCDGWREIDWPEGFGLRACVDLSAEELARRIRALAGTIKKSDGLL